MQCSTVILIFLLIGCSIEAYAIQNNNVGSRFKIVRSQEISSQGNIDEDRWIWGVTNGTTTEKPPKRDNAEIRQRPDLPNPCKRKGPVTPDFNAPGQRISETKCLEYQWDIERREIIEKNERDCKKYRESQGYFEGEAVGGWPAFPGEFPHMAALGWPATAGAWIFKCGGTLISNNFVMTAAHCTKAAATDTTVATLEPVLVVLGNTNLIGARDNELPGSYPILEIIVHPQYKSPKQYYDIALLKLKETVSFDVSINPACLWSQFDTSPIGNEPTITGWGVVETASRMTSLDLQVVNLDVIDSGTCDRLLRPRCNRHWCGIEDTQICAGKLEGGFDACQGDSGGPLQLKINLTTNSGSMYYVIGVTSFGFGCALPDHPGVYTRVSAFIDWIESIVWPKL